jgi:cysteinyl-tRNA synthetase
MKLYDTLSGQKREFQPPGNEVKLYICGITPYAPAHVGHALSYVVFDILRRYLEFRGYRVRHVQNFTDVDDKTIAAARQRGIAVGDLTEGFIQEFYEDMDALRVLRANVYPRATQEVPQILEMIGGLVDKKYAYVAGGDVYYRVTRFEGYGKLSHRTVDGMMAGARVAVDAGKEHPMDFALWKAAKPGEPFWESPWGPGRPGWHIECSAMNLHHLGLQVDIHGGGQDLIFPHHENEIAQSEAYTGAVPFANFWIHNGLLRLEEQKMSKSLGNLVTVREALARYTPDALRLYFLSSHYRSPLAYSDDGVVAHQRAAERLQEAATGDPAQTLGGAPLDPAPFRQRFLDAMDDDLNTPQAVAALFDLSREINRGRDLGSQIAPAQVVLKELAGVLGLTLEVPVARDGSLEPFVGLLAELRDELRTARQYALADKIRDRLQELGIALEDTRQGTRWTFKKL